MNKYLVVYILILLLEILISASLRYTRAVDAVDGDSDAPWYLGSKAPTSAYCKSKQLLVQ